MSADTLLGQKVSYQNGVLMIDGHAIAIEGDDGGCCGWADGDWDYFTDGVITRVDESSTIEDDSAEKLTITVFHEDMRLAAINLSAGSMSGWAYGATSSFILDGTVVESVEY